MTSSAKGTPTFVLRMWCLRTFLFWEVLDTCIAGTWEIRSSKGGWPFLLCEMFDMNYCLVYTCTLFRVSGWITPGEPCLGWDAGYPAWRAFFSATGPSHFPDGACSKVISQLNVAHQTQRVVRVSLRLAHAPISKSNSGGSALDRRPQCRQTAM